MDARKAEGGESSGEIPHSVQSRHQLKKTNRNSMGRRRCNGAGLQSSLHRCRDCNTMHHMRVGLGLTFCYIEVIKKNT